MAKRRIASATPTTQAQRAPHELASLADVQIVRRDEGRIHYSHEEDRPKPWAADALLSAVDLIRGIDFAGPDDLRRNLDFLLNPEEIAHELRGLAEVCYMIGQAELDDKESSCWALEHALRRVAARVAMLQPPAATPLCGAERYAVVAKPTSASAA